METRQMRRKAMKSAPSADLRAVASESTRQSGNANVSAPRIGSIVGDPVSRRGARELPTKRDRESESSSMTRKDNCEDDEDKDRISTSSTETSRQRCSFETDAADVTDTIEKLVPHLLDVTSQLMSFIRNDNKDKADLILLSITSNSFFKLHQSCQLSRTSSPFVDWQPMDSQAAIRALVLANQTMLLLKIIKALNELGSAKSKSDAVDFLQAVDSAFPSLFCLPERSRPQRELSLAIRTSRALEILQSRCSKQYAPETIAKVFCDAEVQDDVETLCRKGPYKNLGGPTDDAIEKELCSSRASEILTWMGGRGLRVLRKQYPLAKLLEELKLWALREYDCSLKTNQNTPPAAAPKGDDNLEDRTEESSSDEEDDAEEPHLILNPQDTEQFIAVYRRDESLRQGGGLSVDHGDDANRNMLTTPQSTAASPSSNCSSTPFETDTRSITNPGNRLAVPARGHHDGCVPSNVRPPPPPSQWSSALTVRKVDLSLQRRRQKRTFWSEHDSQLLIKLIGESVTYSQIERDHAREFQYPRNQLAFRDRARNLKVSMLAKNMRLPPGFDGVCLSKKEEDRLKKKGFNPFRLVDDVDENGIPCNTLYTE